MIEDNISKIPSRTPTGGNRDQNFPSALQRSESKTLLADGPKACNVEPPKITRAQIINAARIAKEHAKKRAIKDCGTYIHFALNGAGIPIEGVGTNPGVGAKNYGRNLVKVGYKELITFKRNSSKGDFPAGYEPKIGDIVVIKPCPGHELGHIAMFDGKEWVAEAWQKDIWGSDMRNYKPNYTIYRAPVMQDSLDA